MRHFIISAIGIAVIFTPSSMRAGAESKIPSLRQLCITALVKEPLGSYATADPDFGEHQRISNAQLERIEQSRAGVSDSLIALFGSIDIYSAPDGLTDAMRICNAAGSIRSSWLQAYAEYCIREEAELYQSAQRTDHTASTLATIGTIVASVGLGHVLPIFLFNHAWKRQVGSLSQDANAMMKTYLSKRLYYLGLGTALSGVTLYVLNRCAQRVADTHRISYNRRTAIVLGIDTANFLSFLFCAGSHLNNALEIVHEYIKLLSKP